MKHELILTIENSMLYIEVKIHSTNVVAHIAKLQKSIL